MKTRTSAYRFTVVSPDCTEVAELRRQVKIENLELRLAYLTGQRDWLVRQNVRIRPRLGKDSPHAHLYRRGGKYHRMTSQDIRPEHGAHFDVYVHERICG